MITCCIFNYAPHYRLPVYLEMARQMEVVFYFGAGLPHKEQIEKLDFSRLPGFERELETIGLGPFKWSPHWLRMAFDKRYGRFLITPDLYAINQWLFLWACRMLRKPVYVWTHGIKVRPPRPDGSATTRILRTWYDRFVTGYFLYSERAGENMWLAGFDARKMNIVYNSLDYKRSKPFRKIIPDNPYKNCLDVRKPVLLFIGRLTSVKRLDLLVRLHDRLKDNGIHTNVVFMGDGPEKQRLQALIRPEDSSEFLFTGAEYDEERIHRYLYHATLCISPGNVGLTAITCLSHGLPVITHDDFDSQMPEYEAVTPGKTGDFYHCGDMDDLSEAAARWIDRLSDPEMREMTRKECYKVIDLHYNPDYQVSVFKKVMK